MDISATTPRISNDIADAASSAEASAAASDFETFLTLLTAQMRNQDPLEPVDSTDYVAQLASFSAVEQQIATNTKLDALADAFALNDAAGLAAWIGRTIDAEGTLRYEGKPLDLSLPPAEEAGTHSIIIRNADGAVVHREPIAAETTTLVWPGTVTGGTARTGDTFTIGRETVTEDGGIVTTSARGPSEVTEIRITEDGPLLITENGAETRLDAVTTLR